MCHRLVFTSGCASCFFAWQDSLAIAEPKTKAPSPALATSVAELVGGPPQGIVCPSPPPPPSLPDTVPFVVNLEEPNEDVLPSGPQAPQQHLPDVPSLTPPPSPRPVGAPSACASPAPSPAAIRSLTVSPGSSSASWSVVPPVAPSPVPPALSSFGPCSRWSHGSISASYRPRGFDLPGALPSLSATFLVPSFRPAPRVDLPLQELAKDLINGITLPKLLSPKLRTNEETPEILNMSRRTRVPLEERAGECLGL